MEMIRKKIVRAQRNDNNGRRTIVSKGNEVSSRYSTPKRTRPIKSLPIPVKKSSQFPANLPATPVSDVLIPDMHLGSQKLAGSTLHDSIWPSRVRSLSVSFQSDTFSLPVRKIEKTNTNPLMDRALKLSVNVSKRESSNLLREPIPEQKRSPVDKRSTITENSKPNRNLSSPLRKSSEESVNEGRGKLDCNAYSSVNRSQIRTKSPRKRSSLLRGHSRGISSAEIRPSTLARQSDSSNSVLSFIADIKRGTKVANHIEDVHQLRLLYNGHLQWLYTNAESDNTFSCRKIQAERTLYSAWRTTSVLRDSVIKKKTELKELKLKLHLYSILNKHIDYLNQWGALENDHVRALSGFVKDLKTNTLHLPVTGGAVIYIETIKSAISSAAGLMQTFGSVIGSALLTMEGMNYLVSELADVASEERAMLDECEALLASTKAMQVTENSLKIQLLGLQEQIRSNRI